MIPTEFVNANPDHEDLRRALCTEIEGGYRAFHNLIEPSVYMSESPLPEVLQQGVDHTQAAFLPIYRYAYLGEISASLHHDDLHDAVAFVLGCRPLAEFYNCETPELAESVLNIAIARAKVDTARGLELPFEVDFWEGSIADAGDARLTVREVAWLARMSERSVRNAMLDGEDRLAAIKEGHNVFIDPLAAADWLSRRRGYVPTRDPHPGDDESVLVPVAKDGSFFSAACRRSQGFQIGKKGEEQYIEDIWAARDALESMNKAYWRRPNALGRFGIVTGVKWERISKEVFLNGSTQASKGE